MLSLSISNTKQVQTIIYFMAHFLRSPYSEVITDQHFEDLTYISMSFHFYQRPLQAVKITSAGRLPHTLITVTYKLDLNLIYSLFMRYLLNTILVI